MTLRNTLSWVLVVMAAVAVAWFMPLPSQDVTRIHSEITIARPPAVVFDYVSTPDNWPAWHPSSLAVRGATDHPLGPGERVTETYLVAGRGSVVIWTVTDRRRPAAWVIEGEIEGRKAGTIAYTLTAQGQGTHFERDFSYTSPTLVFVVLNRLMLHRRIEAESTETLNRLKARLEGGAPAPGTKRPGFPS